MAGEDAGDVGQDAQAILDLQTDLVAGVRRARIEDRQVGVDGLARGVPTEGAVMRRSNEVGQDRRGRGGTARALAVEHESARGLALDKDRVEGAVNGGKRVIGGNLGGVNTHGDALAAVLADAALGDCQELDGVADASGLLHVLLGDAGDTLDGDVVDADARVERQGCQDGALGRGVEALDVCGGVGLGETEVLRLLESILVAQALGAHRVQDEVGRAVDDAHDGRDAVAGEGLTQAVDDGDGARDGGLVVEVSTVGCGSLV